MQRYEDAAKAFEDLLKTRDRLRDPGGCPWDMEQTLETAKTYLLEEAFEAVEAADRKDLRSLAEELGDLIFQALFMARIAMDLGGPHDKEILDEVGLKLISRHPHVFGTEKAETVQEVLLTWGRVKSREEKRKDKSALDGVPTALPALVAAHRLQEKAGQVGFDWQLEQDIRGPWSKIKEEVAELDEALENRDSEQVKDEIGDLLFSIVNLARKLKIDAEGALRSANSRFKSRFEYIEQTLSHEGRTVRDTPLSRLDDLWNEAKSKGN
ncbi:MAG: nucleoside triphosphate pyrophosphohydrolase [Deltaproteobacteria bacterium]|nr:nucleoside triphosphate pyrophosphohydrolase [Deltaproteobacteria bacterium]